MEQVPQITLSPVAQDVTIFITEWGQGFHIDWYTRQFDDITKDMVRKTHCIDDRFLWDDSITVGRMLNPEQFHFAENDVELVRFLITVDENPALHFPTTTNITDIRSWFELGNQESYAFSLAELMGPFRKLIRLKNRKKNFIDFGVWTQNFYSILVSLANSEYFYVKSKCKGKFLLSHFVFFYFRESKTCCSWR